MTRKECLEQAMGCVLRDRNNEYGKPENSFDLIADLWTAYTGHVFIGSDVAAMMALLKLARLKRNARHLDSAVDLAGYAACFAECASAETARPVPFAPKAEGGCCQKGKDHSPEEPEFKAGDAVEWNSVGQNWLPAVYLREFGDFGHCGVQMDGGERIVSKVDLRRPEANYPENPDSSAEAKPEFKYGERVQFRDEIPSTSEPHWFEGVYVERLSDGGHVVKFGPHGHVIHCSDTEIRRAPKAEGCEALVEKDAPQTAQELYKRIIANNPATFKARTPTGEDLAEMAEEEGDACR